MLATLEQMTYFGPARVLAVSGNRAKVELPDEHAWAVLALGTPYEPAAEDEVLVLGGKNSWFVIGVIRGYGTTTLTAPGNFCIRAPHGAIELSAAQHVAVRSPEVTIVTGILEVVAKSVFERFASATRWIKETFQLRAGRIRTRVEGAYGLTAERIQQHAKKDHKIDGEKIYLG